MKNIAIALVVAILSLTATKSALAQDTTGTISQVRVTSSGSIYVRLAGESRLCVGASSAAQLGTFTTTNHSDIALRNMLSLLLSAKLSGTKVKLTTADNAGGYGCAITTVSLL